MKPSPTVSATGGWLGACGRGRRSDRAMTAASGPHAAIDRATTRSAARAGRRADTGTSRTMRDQRTPSVRLLDDDDDEIQRDPEERDRDEGGEHAAGCRTAQPRATLMRTPRPRSAPAHSPTIAPTTASVTPTRIPPRMLGSAAGISSGREDLAPRRPERPAELEQSGVDRRGCRPSWRPRPGRTR